MVKTEKFTLIVSKDDGTTQTKNYKSYKEIAEVLGLNYHQVRELHLLETRPKKFLHLALKTLSAKYKIISIEKKLVDEI